ncbi:glycosyltransferase [Sulfitobacter noctilucicola]|uniref:glycosyltransferase n=1 Tax=Sulfitobacter noctilucicola TaxID=1342301 RepID=UPI0013635FFC|nr:glycosyltransferase [Sulfitobacter noctilucicola]
MLCTYNGAEHLSAQLQSYVAQSHQNWALWVSDDGSTDDTMQILERFQADHEDAYEIRILSGPGKGPAQNFMTTLCNAELPVGYIALSDQDDVWEPEKLTRALTQMTADAVNNPAEIPVIYGAQSIHTDAKLRPIGRSVKPSRPATFGNALVQNVVSGHSCILSPAAVGLVRRTGAPDGIPYHDWWLYLLVAAAGGRILIDDAATLKYRQHESNILGAHRGWRAKTARVRMVLQREYGDWIDCNLHALSELKDELPEATNASVEELLNDPARYGLARIRLLKRLGIYQQTRAGNAVLWLAAFLGRV